MWMKLSLGRGGGSAVRDGFAGRVTGAAAVTAVVGEGAEFGGEAVGKSPPGIELLKGRVAEGGVEGKSVDGFEAGAAASVWTW